jgi:hypothetical protein
VIGGVRVAHTHGVVAHSDSEQMKSAVRRYAILCALLSTSVATSAQAQEISWPGSDGGRPVVEESGPLRGDIWVRSDADCELEVNGAPQGTLRAARVRTLHLPEGDYHLNCVADGVNVETDVAFGERGGASVNLALKDHIADNKALAKDRQRFALLSEDTLRDRAQHLTWTRTNAQQMPWSDALSYCQDKGTWRLPKKDELLKLALVSADPAKCSGQHCGTSALFRLTENKFWSADSFRLFKISVALPDDPEDEGPDEAIAVLCVQYEDRFVPAKRTEIARRVIDTYNGAIWFADDSGFDLDWAEASEWCVKRGARARLPHRAEVATLQQAGDWFQSECGEFNLPVSHSFSLCGSEFWTLDEIGDANAEVANLARSNVAVRFKSTVKADKAAHALCLIEPAK